MRKWLPLSLLVLAGAVQAGETEYFVAAATGKVRVAADGRVESIALDSAVGAEEVAAIERRVRRWRFQPVLRAGAPAPAEASVTMLLAAALPPGATATRIGVEEAMFFDVAMFEAASPVHAGAVIVSPANPRAAVARRTGGRFMLLVRLDAQGAARDALVRSGWVTGPTIRTPEQAAIYQTMFVEAMRVVVPQWRFPGLAGSACVLVPVVFHPGSDDAAGRDWSRARRAVPDPQAAALATDCIPRGAFGMPVATEFVLTSALDDVIP